MRQPVFEKGSPIDEKRISKIEDILLRLARRSRVSTKAVVTPYPVSYCATGDDVRDEIMKYMFCAEGNISKCLFVLDKRPKVGVMVTVNISNDVRGVSKSYVLNKKSFIVEPDIEIFSGDKLTVSVFPLEGEKENIKEVWVSFLWIPYIKDADIKSFLIDELDKSLDDLNKKETNDASSV